MTDATDLPDLPDDPDAATFYAESLRIPVRWKWYSAEGQPADGVEEAERTLEAVMRLLPECAVTGV